MTMDPQALATWTSPQTLATLATAIVSLWILIQQKLNAKNAEHALAIAKDTNNLVNGQHGKALETIAAQAQQLAVLVPTPDSLQKVIDAQKAVADHAPDKETK